jgi:hypothetical protein
MCCCKYDLKKLTPFFNISLAYSEMRQMLARVVWNFDIQLAIDSTDWEKKSEVYLLWNKPPANVYLKPRKIAG